MQTIKNKLRIGLVGCGSLGLQHALHIEKMNDAELVAVSSNRLTSAEQLSSKISTKPTAYDDHSKMFIQEKLDAVLIVTPNDTHCSISISAASAGINVFCEKPLALTVEDCNTMINACKEAGVFLMTGYVRRFENKYREMKKLIQEGKIGTVKMANAIIFGERKSIPGKEWVLSRDTYGGLFSLYSHEMDQLNWMLGDVKSVQATIQYDDTNKNSAEECIFINLLFKAGFIGSLSCSRIYQGRNYEYSVTGSKGTLRISSGKDTSLWLYPSDSEPREIQIEQNNSMQEEIQYFFDCIRNGTPPESNGNDGKRTIEIAMAALKSAETGNRINL